MVADDETDKDVKDFMRDRIDEYGVVEIIPLSEADPDAEFKPPSCFMEWQTLKGAVMTAQFIARQIKFLDPDEKLNNKPSCDRCQEELKYGARACKNCGIYFWLWCISRCSLCMCGSGIQPDNSIDYVLTEFAKADKTMESAEDEHPMFTQKCSIDSSTAQCYTEVHLRTRIISTPSWKSARSLSM